MKLLHEFFENQAQNIPHHLALITAQKRMTYQSLSHYTNQIAHQLLQYDIKKNTLVAIVMEKGWEQIVAVLSILKAGAAYLPIDANEFPERLSYLLKVGEVRCVLTQKKYQSHLSWPDDICVLAVDDESTGANYSNDNLPITQNENDLAYVIFTSGTTGIPKGVMINHRGAVNTLLDMNHRFQISTKDRVLAVSALHFDLSVYDIFGTLAAGGAIILPTNDESRDPSRWTPIFLKEQVSIINCVPALMQIFVEHLSNQYSINSLKNNHLRLVLLSGDWIPLTLPHKVRALFGKQIEIISLGGATEASIWSILYSIKKINKKWKSIPYGKSMKNQAFYILDKELNAIAPEDYGELYIGGFGLAQGYWRDPQRTQSAFITHPQLGCLYKTGDLGRYLPDGHIEFLGRVDYQVKVNGHRIELSAIENCLLEHPSVCKACVITADNHLNKYLVAYIVLGEEYIKNNLLLTRMQVAQWHKIHNDLGNNQESFPNPIFNTHGWISSFTQKPMSDEVMQEWVSQTTAKILSLKPKKVLEIGCGLGLLLFRLASHTSTYEGLDYSHSAIHYIQQQLPSSQSKIGLQLGEAKNISELYADRTFDVVILNSIIQYFPSIDYLIDVLNQSIALTEPGGYVFIGDIRSLIHLPHFYAAIQWSQSPQNIAWAKWRSILDYYLLQEEELVIDHRFFYAFQKINPRITAVDIQIKRGQCTSEMNLFRYDVILFIDRPCLNSLAPKKIDWSKTLIDMDALRSLLQKGGSSVWIMEGLPNQRVAGLDEVLIQGNYTSSQWTKSAQQALAIARERAIDPQQLYQLGEELGYSVSLTWSEKNSENNIDAIFFKRKFADEVYSTSHLFSENTTSDLLRYANMPLRAKAVERIFLKLKKFLRTKLPAYMIPNIFMALDALPMSSNGKIDRQAFPPPNLNIRAMEYVPPTSEIEKKLEKVWLKIFKLDKIGVYDNFYELGGTSLLAVQMVSEIQKAFLIHLNIGDIIFHGQSIHALSLLLLRKMGQSEMKEKSNLHKVV